MRNFHQMHLGYAGAGRIYVTSPSFGVDLSVDYVRGEFSVAYEEQEFFAGSPRRLLGSVFSQMEYVLTLRFGLPGLSLFKPYDGHDASIMLLDHTKPPPPKNPLWLPGGVWNCEYCNSAQLADLLQCRNCGGPRYAGAWGSGSEED